jgi:hypothetical protein
MGQTNTSSYQKLDANFVFIKEDTIEFEHFLGILEVKDNGFTKNCSYDSIKTIMIKKAEALGANCLVVQNHKTPNGLSTCHRLEARMYWIDNPYDYEKIIYWSDSRHLKIRDFKGTTINRPFEAATFSAIGYTYRISPWNGQLEVGVQTYFDCQKSYFKKSEHELKTLSHEQVHFDISEIYAQKLFKRFKNEITTFNEMSEKSKAIYEEIVNEMILKQDEYDSEVYKNRSLEKKWAIWAEQELKSSADFAHKSFKGEKIKLKKVIRRKSKDDGF